MKRYRNVFPSVASLAALHAAWRRARLGKRRLRAVLEFERDLEGNLLRLERDLLDGSWRPGEYRTFIVTEPRHRMIAAAPFADRVVHHALVDAVEPLLDRHFRHDSHACREGHGTHMAADRFQFHARRQRYVLQLDIRRFFATVDHQVVVEQLAERIDDARVLGLFRVILGSFKTDEHPGFFQGDDLFTPVQRARGLPVGNLPSQFLANVLLDPIDRLIEDRLRLRFVRYCDDFAIFADDKPRLHEAHAVVSGALEALRLRLHPRKCKILPVTAGPEFVGYRIWPDRRRLRRENVRMFRRRMRRWRAALAAGHVQMADITPRVRAWIAHARHADTVVLRESIFRDMPIRG